MICDTYLYYFINERCGHRVSQGMDMDTVPKRYEKFLVAIATFSVHIVSLLHPRVISHSEDSRASVWYEIQQGD